MAELSIPAIVLCDFTHAAPAVALISRERFDVDGLAPATIGELAVDKTTAGEAPHPLARVAVFRLFDLAKVWEGFADEQGRWQADGLREGVDYVAVGIDPKRVFKATAAGPVRAPVGASLVGAQEGGDG